jgi:DNA-binding CsgD family transcriptional regulator
MSRDPCVPNPISDIEFQYLKHCVESKVNKDSKIRPYPTLTDDCWIWNGSVDAVGRGVYQTDLSKKLRIIKAHRLSMYLFKPTEWKHELDVLHSCDNPICVNPNHLRMGTQTENNNDRDTRDRQVTLSGTKSGTSKFTETDIKEIIKLRKSGKTYPEIAEIYKVHRKTIQRICIGKTGYIENPIEKPSRIELISGNVIEYTNAGMTTDEICLKLKTSSATVAAIRKDMDKPELLKDSKDLELRIIELYNKSKTIKEISDECDIGTTTVNKIIIKSGIKRLSKSERARAEIMELHGQGKTQAQICEQTGFCRTTVYKIITTKPGT